MSQSSSKRKTHLPCRQSLTRPTRMTARVLHKVFVYGTLKRGEPNHHWFAKSPEGHHQFLYRGHTKEKFPLIIATDYNVPFLLYAPGKGHRVQGEVYEVDDAVLKNLDILEDHPSFYRREEFEVERDDGREPKSDRVWIYSIREFRKELLNKPCLESYSDQGSHGLRYVESDESSIGDLL
ncbi:putative gamma-glutamylcyclotransferase CG2811 isoform X2 [Dendroctonus ponderosae]|nr:putative gamma-glutamylcyclotransferase CG2811 isoform X2 [Dendroctonus ponderosae]